MLRHALIGFALLPIFSTAKGEVIKIETSKGEYSAKSGVVNGSSLSSGGFTTTFDQAGAQTPAGKGVNRLWDIVGRHLANKDEGPKPFSIELRTTWEQDQGVPEDDNSDWESSTEFAVVTQYRDTHGALWNRQALILALAAAFDGNVDSAAKAFKATFEFPNPKVSQEEKDLVLATLKTLDGQSNKGEGDSVGPRDAPPASQPDEITIEFKGTVTIGYGPFSVSGETHVRYHGTPEGLSRFLDRSWEQFKGIVRDIGGGMRDLWRQVFGGGATPPPPQGPPHGP